MIYVYYATCLFLVLPSFLAFTNTSASLSTIKYKKYVLDDKCTKVKCPIEKNPACVKLKNFASGKTAYYLLSNKCEIQNIHCSKDIDATEVENKYCNVTSTLLPPIIDNVKEHNRRKRSFSRDASDEQQSTEKKLYNLIFLKDHSAEGDYKNKYGDSPQQLGSIENNAAEVDIEQYNADCPTVCPARDVMVCGRLSNGLYKTFLSTCHMRMYDCKEGNKGTQLISRQPCVLSAPYLENTQGTLSDDSDKDIVLMFLFCRFKNGDDPRCNNETFKRIE